VSDTDLAQPGIAIEAKRFEHKTDLPLDALKAKLREFLDSSPEIDVWASPSPAKSNPDWSELKKIALERGVLKPGFWAVPMRWGKAFPLAGAKVAGTPPSAGKPRNAPRVRVQPGRP